MTDTASGIGRVLMTADTLGGIWPYALELAGALQPYGIEVVLAAMGRRPTAAQQAQAAAMPNLCLFESAYRLEWMDDPWEEVAKAGQWLLGLEADTEPDLVHLNGYCHASLPWRSPTLVVGHSCVFSWFKAVRGAFPANGWERYRREVKAGLQAAGGVTAPTQAMLDALRKIYGSFAACRPIYNGRKGGDFPADPKAPIIMSAGRIWDEAKNIAALEEIAGRLSWPVYVAGELVHPSNGGRSRLENVVPLGLLDSRELGRWFARAAIYVLPARYEPFGLSALEAALAGCALVLGDIASLREVWEDAAFYVAPEDPEALLAALSALIRANGLRSALARRARLRALTYTPERMGAAYADLYRRVRKRGLKTNFEYRTSQAES